MWTELGPQGFLPQDPAQLRDELATRGLKVCGGTVFAGLHKGKEALDKAIEEFGQEAKLLREVGAKYLVHLPEQYTDMHTGEATEAADIDPEQWSNLISGTNELARYLLRSTASSWCSTRTPTPTWTPRTGSCSSWRTPTRSSSTCAWTPATSPTATATTSRSSSGPRSGSPTCTSSSSTRRSGNGSGRRSCRWPRPCRWASWSSRRTASRRAAAAGRAGRLDRDIFTVIEQDLYPVAPHIPLPIQARAAGYLALRARPRPALALLNPTSLERKDFP